MYITDIYQSILKKKKRVYLFYIIIGLILCVPNIALLISTGASNQKGAGAMLFLILAGLLICLGSIGFLSSAANKKRMINLGIDENAIMEFNQEYIKWNMAASTNKALIKLTPGIQITKNYILRQNIFGVTLLPLNEVVWFYKHVLQGGGVINSVYVFFSDGGAGFRINCGEQAAFGRNTDTTEEWLKTLSELCPNSMIGYSHRKEDFWLKNKKEFIGNIKNGIFDFAD